MSNVLAQHAHHHDTDSMDVFGFWLYILSDCILFSAIFATFAVLHNNTYGGPTIASLSSLKYVFVETMLLLASSFVFGLAVLQMYKKKMLGVLFFLVLTFAFGAGFVGMEINEFIEILHEGYSWQTSAALSSFFTLVGTHGLHVFIGLAWLLVMMVQLVRFGMTQAMVRRLTYFGLFWAFLDVVWIFVFTIVYLMEAI